VRREAGSRRGRLELGVGLSDRAVGEWRDDGSAGGLADMELPLQHSEAQMVVDIEISC
jgi:hypothetical protein